MLFLTSWFGVTGSEADRDLAAEPAIIDAIVERVLAMQTSAAAEQQRPLARGTHAKGVCARAQFEVLDVPAGRNPELAARLAQGIYVKPGIYSAIVRFANSDPHVNSDSKADVRSLSFSVELAPDGGNPLRQDYSMQSATTLPLNDAAAFLAVMKVISASSPARAAWSLSLKDKLRFVRSMLLVQSQLRQPIRPYQQLRYWSDVPFRHGPTDVVKYCATPSADNPARALRKDNPNVLQDELIRHLNDDTQMSCFDFGLQLLDTEKTTYWGRSQDAGFWIENASIEWNEAQAPFHTVARLTLLPKSQLTPEASEAVYFDVTGNSTSDSTPLGSINRARWPAEVASRKARTRTVDSTQPQTHSLVSDLETKRLA
jgi:hypothetical protein